LIVPIIMYLLLDIDMAALNCRQAGRSDKGNHLESGEIRGNMLTRWFGFVPPCRASAPLMRRTVEYF